MKFPGILACAAVLAVCGCGTGSASVTGAINGYSIDPSTVYAWIADTMETSSNGKTVYTVRDTKPLFIVLSGASFNPQQDPRFLDAQTSAQIARDQAKFGMILVQVPDLSKVVVGTPIQSADNGLGVGLAFAEHEVDASTGIPATPTILGSTRKFALTFTKIGTKVGDTLAGTLLLNFTKNTYDPTDAVEGTLTVQFTAPVISEVLGACWTPTSSGMGSTMSCDPSAPGH